MDRRKIADFLRGSAHVVFTIGWLGMIPVAYITGWLYSLAFISAASIYANAASHLAAWLADESKRLKRIEAKLDAILEALQK